MAREQFPQVAARHRSAVDRFLDLAVTHPTTGKLIEPVSLLSVDGLHRILPGLVTNFTSFAPLGTVLVAMIGIGVAYGIGAGTVRSDRDVIKGMSQQMSTLGGYLVLVFFAAQFVAFFDWTNLGLILAVDGAEFLKSAGLHQVPMFMLLGWPVGPGVPTALPSGAPAAP